jgi:hypothetical protein
MWTREGPKEEVKWSLFRRSCFSALVAKLAQQGVLPSRDAVLRRFPYLESLESSIDEVEHVEYVQWTSYGKTHEFYISTVDMVA